MAIRDLIPWSRHENRLPIPGSASSSRDEHPILSLHREVNRLFDEAFGMSGAPSLGGLSWPKVELGETEREIRVIAELPGLDQKDVDVTVEDGLLTLRGEKRSELDDRERGYTERSYGRFERRIGLPKGIDRDHASATFRNGVLTVTLPRTEAANENVRRIPVAADAA